MHYQFEELATPVPQSDVAGCALTPVAAAGYDAMPSRARRELLEFGGAAALGVTPAPCFWARRCVFFFFFFFFFFFLLVFRLFLYILVSDSFKTN
jgi:hypothetical protein